MGAIEPQQFCYKKHFVQITSIYSQRSYREIKRRVLSIRIEQIWKSCPTSSVSDSASWLFIFQVIPSPHKWITPHEWGGFSLGIFQISKLSLTVGDEVQLLQIEVQISGAVFRAQ